ncbi:MAG: hypothetical protein HQK51_04975 [Oligoflexia bacterium]|nr:hypothetical protein [Oligoflexia bacterium]
MDNYDCAIGWRGELDDFFINHLYDQCIAKGLKVIIIDEKALLNLSHEIRAGELRIKFYYDFASETFDKNDGFMKMAYLLKYAGTQIVDDPDNVKAAADKSITHFNLIRNNISVPRSLIVSKENTISSLTSEEKQKLGENVVLKPALGYALKGVKITTLEKALLEILNIQKNDDQQRFLIQEIIRPQDLDGRPAWFRVFHFFSELIICWWDPNTHIYKQTSLQEMDKYKLFPILPIVNKIGRITNIDWFSTEITINKNNGDFVVIDYVNDQCMMDPQSKSYDGVPDSLVIHLATRMAEKVHYYIRNKKAYDQMAIWLPIEPGL